MRIISIFGGSGFIGSELVSELAKNEFEIRLFTRNKIKANHLKIIPRLKFIQLTDDNFLEKINIHVIFSPMKQGLIYFYDRFRVGSHYIIFLSIIIFS